MLRVEFMHKGAGSQGDFQMQQVFRDCYRDEARRKHLGASLSKPLTVKIPSFFVKSMLLLLRQRSKWQGRTSKRPARRS